MERGAQVGKTLAGNGNVVLRLMGIDLPSVRARGFPSRRIRRREKVKNNARFMRLLCRIRRISADEQTTGENDIAGILYESKFHFSLVTLPVTISRRIRLAMLLRQRSPFFRILRPDETTESRDNVDQSGKKYSG